MTPLIFLIVVLAAAALLYAVIEGGSRKKGRRRGASRAGRSHVDRAEIRARWATVMATAGTGPSGLKNALGEADKLFDHALRQLGYGGQTMGDRLKAARDGFSDRAITDGVWRAHKLRNALAHEVGFDLVPTQAREALRDFERGLRDLGAL